MTTRTSASYRLTLTVGLCFLVALMEGLDLQAAGIAAVGIAHAFALDKMQMGWIFSAGILGLLPGALVGGMLADRYGRKRILIASVALFGLFSLATAISWDFSSLVFARLMTGVGLGANKYVVHSGGNTSYRRSYSVKYWFWLASFFRK